MLLIIYHPSGQIIVYFPTWMVDFYGMILQIGVVDS